MDGLLFADNVGSRLNFTGQCEHQLKTENTLRQAARLSSSNGNTCSAFSERPPLISGQHFLAQALCRHGHQKKPDHINWFETSWSREFFLTKFSARKTTCTNPLHCRLSCRLRIHLTHQPTCERCPLTGRWLVAQVYAIARGSALIAYTVSQLHKCVYVPLPSLSHVIYWNPTSLWATSRKKRFSPW